MYIFVSASSTYGYTYFKHSHIYICLFDEIAVEDREPREVRTGIQGSRNTRLMRVLGTLVCIEYIKKSTVLLLLAMR